MGLLWTLLSGVTTVTNINLAVIMAINCVCLLTPITLDKFVTGVYVRELKMCFISELSLYAHLCHLQYSK